MLSLLGVFVLLTCIFDNVTAVTNLPRMMVTYSKKGGSFDLLNPQQLETMKTQAADAVMNPVYGKDSLSSLAHTISLTRTSFVETSRRIRSRNRIRHQINDKSGLKVGTSAGPGTGIVVEDHVNGQHNGKYSQATVGVCLRRTWLKGAFWRTDLLYTTWHGRHTSNLVAFVVSATEVSDVGTLVSGSHADATFEDYDLVQLSRTGWDAASWHSCTCQGIVPATHLAANLMVFLNWQQQLPAHIKNVARVEFRGSRAGVVSARLADVTFELGVPVSLSQNAPTNGWLQLRNFASSTRLVAGDSGGPLTLNVAGHSFLLGILKGDYQISGGQLVYRFTSIWHLSLPAGYNFC